MERHLTDAAAPMLLPKLMRPAESQQFRKVTIHNRSAQRRRLQQSQGPPRRSGGGRGRGAPNDRVCRLETLSPTVLADNRGIVGPYTIEQKKTSNVTPAKAHTR
jgi:hypothetical protein